MCLCLMPLKLYNTRTKRKETFEPLDPDAIRMYVCGPTVYDRAHIGNARPIIVFDVLFRLLRHLAAKGEWDGGRGDTRVVYARNVTDVDDKINARAAELGIPIGELTAKTIADFHDDIRALGVLMPQDVNEAGKPPVFFEPRATEYIDKPDAPEDMSRMITRLIERGHAYEAEGHVLFSVASDPNYGRLARRSVEEMRAGARVEIAPYKRDPMDFVLWKPSTRPEPGWDSPWGFGRPGWHLECSAMSAALLGKTFDIHGGGIDLLFPHHENEVAQSTCAHGTEIMANIWMHNGHLQVEGAKMSKSAGNFVTVRDFLQSQSNLIGSAGETLKFAMLMTHYRQPLDFTADRVAEARAVLRDFGFALHNQDPLDEEPSGELIAALKDDLNTHEVKIILQRLAAQARSLDGEVAVRAVRQLIWALKFLGFDDLIASHARVDFNLRRAVGEDVRVKIKEFIEVRSAARKAKNWAEADRIRDELAAMGITLKDAKNKDTGEIETTWEVAR